MGLLQRFLEHFKDFPRKCVSDQRRTTPFWRKIWKKFKNFLSKRSDSDNVQLFQIHIRPGQKVLDPDPSVPPCRIFISWLFFSANNSPRYCWCVVFLLKRTSLHGHGQILIYEVLFIFYWMNVVSLVLFKQSPFYKRCSCASFYNLFPRSVWIYTSFFWPISYPV